MSGFRYKNKSTETIIGRRLILCSYVGAVDSVIGVQRQNQLGEATITKQIPNEYGTISENLQFSYTLIIDPCETDTVSYITQEEQIIIERWLTSSKYSSDLEIINDNDEVVATYCGKFISTEWIPFEDGYDGVTFNFENNGPYAKEHYSFMESSTESGGWSCIINCDTDELEEYIYPIITITNPNDTCDIRITNQTDLGAINQVTIKAEQNIPIVMDCNHCILTNGITNNTFSFDDIGWTDVGNIYWPRLLPGDNIFLFDKPCNVEIQFDAVRKIVGGWLYD